MGNWILNSIRTEPSKWFSIVLSSLALLISFVSLLEAHRGRLINETINRPVVTVETNGSAIARWAKEGSGDFLVRTFFVSREIKNLGKTPAIINKVDHEITPIGECEVGEVDEVPFKALEGKEVIPNLSLWANQSFPILTACNGKEITLLSDLVIHYTDTVSGTPYEQRFYNIVSVPDPTPDPSPSP